MGWQDAPVVGGADQPAAQAAAPSQKWQQAPVVADVPSGSPGWQTEQAPLYSPETSAGIGDTAVASLASDPAQRMQYYSQQRGVPIDRYKVIQGRVAYLDKKGDWRYEESPNFLPHSMAEAGQQIASGVGPAIPAIAGGAVGIASSPLMLTGPAGLGVSLAATGAAGAGAEAVRQGLADKFVAPREIDKGKILMEGAQAMVGQGLGAGLGALEQRYAVPDIGRLNTPAADALEAKAGRMNPPIQLTPAESTNLASLKSQQKMLGNMPQTSDDMAAFYANRQTNQITPNVENFLASVSPEQSATVAGMKGRDAAKSAIEKMAKERTAAASPAYESVVKPENIVDPAKLKNLLNDDFFREQIAAVKNESLAGMKDFADTSLPVLDKVKKNLDYAIAQAALAGDRDKVRLLKIRLRQMVGKNGAVDLAYPDYPVARALFAKKSPEFDEVANGVLKSISKMKDPRAQDAARLLFGEGSSDKQITIAVNTLTKRDPETLQALKRAFLQAEWESAGKQTLAGESVNQGAKFRLSLFGDAPSQRRIKAMLSPQEHSALQDMADVLEASGRVKPLGSDTEWNKELMKQARNNATPMWARITGNAVSPQKWGELVKDWATEKNLVKHAQEVTDIITNPEGRKLLKELKVVSPNSIRFKVGVGHLLTQLPSIAARGSAPSRQDPQQSAKKEGR